MTVTSQFDTLDTSDCFPRREVVSRWLKRVFRAVNATYEGLWDAVAPGGTTQVWVGHDHGEEGGAPLIRNSQFNGDGFTAEVWRKTDFSRGDVASAPWIAQFYVSPGLSTSTNKKTFQEVSICYKAVGGSFEVWAGEGDHVTLEENSNDGPSYKTLLRPITVEKDWVQLILFIQPANTSSSTVEFHLYSVNVIETYGNSQPSLKQRWLRELTQGVASSETILSYFGSSSPLADELVAKDEWLDTYLLKTLYSALNALFEGIMDWTAPGASSQYIKGHDHAATADGGTGGRPVGMGKTWSALAAWDGSDYYWLNPGKTTTLAAGTWYYADVDETRRRTTAGSSPGGLASTDPMFKLWVEEGFTSSGNPPTSYPYLDGWIKLDCDKTTAAIDVKLYNKTTIDYSDTTSFTSANFNKWVYVDHIPCSAGAWNDFWIEIKSDTEGAKISIDGLVISETYEYSGNKTCYTSSSGTRILGRVMGGGIGVPRQ